SAVGARPSRRTSTTAACSTRSTSLPSEPSRVVNRPSAPSPAPRRFRLRRRGGLPGFNLTLGYSVFYVRLLGLVPLMAMALKASTNGLTAFWNAVSDERALAAYQVSFVTALSGAAINAVFGLVVAWVLARYTFPGKSVLDALVDLPFALPTAVA